MPTTTIARDRLGRRARFAAAVVVILSVALFVASLALARDNRLPSGGGLGADHLAFYDAGDILCRLGADRLYDLPLQSALYHARLPGEPPDAFLPYAYAPHVAAAFALLTALPYAASYFVWTLLSVVAYLSAVVMSIRAGQLPRAWWSTVGWLAASFEPFAFECVHGGQIATVAAALLSAAAMLSIAGRPFTAGLVLGCCCYKPTLLILVVPALLLTRRWSTVAGFATSVAGWAGIDLLAFGVTPCRMYVNLLTGYAGHSALDFRLWKFVDAHSFALLMGGSENVAMSAAVIAAIGALTLIVTGSKERPCGTAATRGSDADRRFWAAVLAWTPVANLYAGAYDAVLLVPAAILLAGVLHGQGGPLPRRFIAILAALWIAPWFTSAIALATGVQVLSIAAAALAVQIPVVGRRRSPEMDWATISVKRPAESSFRSRAPALPWRDIAPWVPGREGSR